MAIINGLVAYWKLDEASGSRTDIFGGNTLTDNNTVTSNTGKLGNAAEFASANSESLSSADNPSLSTGDINFSFTGWFYPVDDSVANTHNILSKRATATNLEHEIRFDPQLTDWLRLVLFDNAGTVVANIAWDGSITYDAWHFFFVYHDAVNDRVGISLDGGAVTTAATTGVPSDTTANFRIGARNTTPQTFFNGRIDAVGFWKRVLGQQEITELYNGGAGLEYPFNSNRLSVFPYVKVGNGMSRNEGAT